MPPGWVAVGSAAVVAAAPAAVAAAGSTAVAAVGQLESRGRAVVEDDPEAPEVGTKLVADEALPTQSGLPVQEDVPGRKKK